MNRLFATLILSVLFLPISNDIQAQNRLSETLEASCKKNHIPALAVSVFKSDTVLAMEIYGSSYMGKGDTLNIYKRFHLGSNTKAFTSLLAAMMVEQGAITWNTKVFDIFPDWEEGSNSAYKNVTLEDLLSHRAWIQPFVAGTEFLTLPKFKGNDTERRKKFSKWLLEQEPVNHDGKTYVYSNAGYSIAAAMLEEKGGMPWKGLIEKQILGRNAIGLGYGWPAKRDTLQPWGHLQITPGDTILFPTPPDHEYELDEIVAPAGDLNMSVKEYTKFLQYHLKGLNGQSNMVSSATYKKMHNGRSEYALGWINVEQNGKHFSTHDGSAGTFYCHASLAHEDDLGIIVMANSAHPEAITGIYELLDQLRKQYGKR